MSGEPPTPPTGTKKRRERHEVGRAVGQRPAHPVRQDRPSPRCRRPSWSRSSSRPTSRPGTANSPCGWPCAASVRANGPSHSTRLLASRIDEVRGRAEAVLVERVAGDRQRVVDPDRLAGELEAVLVDRRGRYVKSAKLPSARRGASNPKFFTTSRPGVPIGWTVWRLAPGEQEPGLDAEPGRDRGRDEEQDEPGVGQQRRQLRPAVAVAVEVDRAVGLALGPDAEPVRPEDRPHGFGASGRPSRARSGRLGS